MPNEARKPPPNRGASDGIIGNLRFAIRRFLDLQVSSVVADIAPWLKERTGSVLEVGCGDQPYRRMLPDRCAYTGLDWEGSAAEFSVQRIADVVYYRGDVFPFDDELFDAVFHTEVIEHVADYRLFLQECHRVLKPGGELMFTVPFQARFHFIPVDFWRFTKSGLELILADARFSEVRAQPRGTDVVVACYKVVSILYRCAYGRILGKAAFILLSWLAVLLLALAHLCMKFKLGSDDDCLGYSVFASRPQPQTTSKFSASGVSDNARG
jgi:SAM-dependent methyltransferase